jgi:hypothetical protein
MLTPKASILSRVTTVGVLVTTPAVDCVAPAPFHVVRFEPASAP